ncbi:MAG: VWA domain-containing protein [Burkholderiales bacterium]|nr:VWA domain-containing protein [Burkholderiales bacterium]
MNAQLSVNSRVIVTPMRAGLVAGQDNIVDVLVRIQAPDQPPDSARQHPPMALALVLDRSGSMRGRPLSEAKRCAQYVLQTSRPVDAVAVIQFDGEVDRLCSALPLGDGHAQALVLQDLEAGGSTNLHGGWHEGAEALSEVGCSGLKRVILLSDGGANVGITDAGMITAQCAGWAARGITTSTFGLGNHFNEDLMVEIARAGGGNSYYGDKAEDLMEPFQRELELLGNLAILQLHLTAEPSVGVHVEMLNALSFLDGGWRLIDLPWGAEAWAMLQLHVSATALAGTQPMPLLRVAVRGRSLEGEAVELGPAGLALPVLPQARWQALPADELVKRRLDEVFAAQALADMRSAASQGDWVHVESLLAAAAEQFSGNPWVAAVLKSMRRLAARREQERFSKEAAYATRTMRARPAAKFEEGDYALTAEEASPLPAYLRRKVTQGKGKKSEL